MTKIFNFQFSIFNPRASRGGQAALSMVLLIGGIMVLIGFSLVFLSTSFINSAYGNRAAQQAQNVATSGAYDAMIQLARNKDFSSGGYSVAVGSSTATVVVTQDSPATGEVAIVSTATISLYKKTIRVVVSRNASTSQIVVVSWGAM